MMANLNSLATTAYAQPGNAYTYSLTLQTASIPQMNTTEQEQWDWQELPDDDPCKIYWKLREEDEKKGLSLPHPMSFDPSRQMIPDFNHQDRNRWYKCHLLSLPKDIRLKIWGHVLTDPLNSDMLVGIDRESYSPCYKLERPPTPRIKFFHVGRRTQRSIDILLVNRTVYEESLPVLYRSAKFMPSDLEGLLPLFLNGLSPFARSCIQKVHLCIPKHVDIPGFRNDRSKPFFHWAVTCAQVAKLNDTLHEVEIDGEWTVFEKMANRRGILFPLCKIKAAKKFIPNTRGDNDPLDYDLAFQGLLSDAKETLKLKAKVREECTKADALELAKRNESRELEALEAESRRNKDCNNAWAVERCRLKSRSRFKVPLEEASEESGVSQEGRVWTEEDSQRMDTDLSSVKGIKQFEKELEEHSIAGPSNEDAVFFGEDLTIEDWDLVSIRSGASTPKARKNSIISSYSDVTWPDTASTLVSKDEVGLSGAHKGDDSDAESESWEHVE